MESVARNTSPFSKALAGGPTVVERGGVRNVWPIPYCVTGINSSKPLHLTVSTAIRLYSSIITQLITQCGLLA